LKTYMNSEPKIGRNKGKFNCWVSVTEARRGPGREGKKRNLQEGGALFPTIQRQSNNFLKFFPSEKRLNPDHLRGLEYRRLKKKIRGRSERSRRRGGKKIRWAEKIKDDSREKQIKRIRQTVGAGGT